MIIGAGIENKLGELAFPEFAIFDGHYSFIMVKENGHCDLIKVVDYNKFINWIPDEDFKKDTLRIADKSFNGVMTQLMLEGCQDAKDEFQSLMSEYYEQNP